jgi:GTPase involved in cell partitioning and DNA repair
VQLLLYVVDCSSSAALEGVGRGPSQDLRCLFNELTLYDPALLAKPSLVFANKIDIDGV